MKYTCYGVVRVPVQITVEAADEDHALDMASELWPGLTGYAGNGAMSGRLIGHADPNTYIEAPDDSPEWDSAEPTEEP